MKKYETKYRVIPNPSFNDFNAELPYTIVAVDYDPKTDLIRQRGFNSWSNHKCDLFNTRQSCECWFVTLINNEFVSTLKRNTAELQRQLNVAKKALKMAVADKCKAENIIAESLVGKGAKVAIPKKEQWYLEQAESELKGEPK